MSLLVGGNPSVVDTEDLLQDGDSSVGETSKLSKVWNFTKTYFLHLGVVALEVAIPLVTLVAVSGAADVRDPERFGLSWLHWTRLNNDLERETMYPSHEPCSKAQKNRLEAAQAVESLITTTE